ncbi:MAG: DUF2501 domain-containing protein [Burkholderiaceae bacterium]
MPLVEDHPHAAHSPAVSSSGALSAPSCDHSASARPPMRAARRIAPLLLAVAAGLAAVAPGASAQNLDKLKGMVGGGKESAGEAAGGIGGALPSLGSMNIGSLGNATGVVEYCIKNNYLDGGASGIKDKLMGKLSGGDTKPSEDSGYLAGAKGLFNTSDGKSVDLSGGGLKEKFTKQVCEQVLKQAKNLL